MYKCILDKYFEKTKGFYPFFKYCPKKYQTYYINKRAGLTLGYDYNYLEPKSFNEKIRWLIYNERLKSKSLLTDKIKVKTYVTALIGEGHTAPIYGIWDNFDDIDFSYIPDEFVLKVNHVWRTNIIVHNKKNIYQNIDTIRKTVQKWLKIKYEQYSLEPQYKGIKPKVFIEYLRPIKRGLRRDYQIHCFNGRPLMIEVPNSNNLSGACFYDTDWNELSYTINSIPRNGTKEVKPDFLQKMIEYSVILAKGFSYVRIDFAECEDNIHVGEMTFTPYSAMIPFSDKAYDYEIGALLKL